MVVAPCTTAVRSGAARRTRIAASLAGGLAPRVGGICRGGEPATAGGEDRERGPVHPERAAPQHLHGAQAAHLGVMHGRWALAPRVPPPRDLRDPLAPAGLVASVACQHHGQHGQAPAARPPRKDRGRLCSVAPVPGGLPGVASPVSFESLKSMFVASWFLLHGAT